MVVIATGVVDHFPHFHGWEPTVGVSMFWCITCDGYESRGKDILVVGHTNDAASEAMQLHSLTDKVRLLTNSSTFEITETFQRRLAAAEIPVIHDKIESAEVDGGQIQAVITKGGLRLELERLFSIQGATPESTLGANLGVARTEMGYIVVDTRAKDERARRLRRRRHLHPPPAAGHRRRPRRRPGRLRRQLLPLPGRTEGRVGRCFLDRTWPSRRPKLNLRADQTNPAKPGCITGSGD